jgi:two-component system sensor histidine kinase/response regulator
MDAQQKELSHERSLLRTLIDNLPDCIYAKDAEARKIIANPADLENLGCKTEAEAIGKTDHDFFPPDIAAGFFADDQSVLQTGKAVINRGEKVVMPDGETRWLLTTKIPCWQNRL